MSAELLREAAGQIRLDYSEGGYLCSHWKREYHLAAAEWLEYQANYEHLWRHLSESPAPLAFARAYLGRES